MAIDCLVCSYVSGLSALFNKAQKKPDETEILHLLLHGSLTRYLYSMCWYNEAVQNQTEFSPMVALVTEKISDGLVFLGGTGITGALVLFDRSTGSDTRGSIDAVLMPIMPAIFVFATYVFSIDLLRGYYLFKYSEQYREQFGYSAKDWYGEKSKEYRRMQG